MESFQFFNPTKILCGEGIFDNLPNTISNTYKNIFIVTDSNILNILGGVRSSCTYVGAPSLKQLSKCTTFVRVSKQ